MAWAWAGAGAGAGASFSSFFSHSYLEILLSLASFLLLFALRHVNRRRSFPVNWPVIGMLPALIAHIHHIHDWISEATVHVGCTFLFKGPWFMSMDMLITSDPANVNHIFNTNFLNYPKGDEFLEMFDVLGDGIFNADAESWRNQRKMAHSFMSEKKFRSFVTKCSKDKVENGLNPLLDRVAELQQVIDLQDVFLRFTFDTTCNLVFGIDPGCLSASFPTIPFAKAMDDAMKAIFSRHIMPPLCWKLLRRLGVGEEKKLVKARIAIDDFVAQSIAKKKENNKEEGEAVGDLLTSYINHPVSDEVSNNKFLRDTTVNLMLAGRDTTGTALTWFFWLLSKHPDVQTKILHELKANLPFKESTPDAEDIGKLVYLHAALCESLRLYPPVPFEHKAALKPEFLPSGHEARPGTKILISLYAMGRTEGVWGKDCLEFKPERWISEKGKLSREPSYKFLSFNSGPRTCLGKDMAFTQMKVVVASLLQRFHFDVVEGHVVEPKLSIILHMRYGLRVRVRKKEQEMLMVNRS